MKYTTEDGQVVRQKNRRYIDRKYIKKKQKLSFKDWAKLVKYNAVQGKQFQDDGRNTRIPTSAIED